jgi:hypothetical protein
MKTAVLTLINGSEICSRKGNMVSRERHERLVLPSLTVCFDARYWRRDLVRFDSGPQTLKYLVRTSLRKINKFACPDIPVQMCEGVVGYDLSGRT